MNILRFFIISAIAIIAVSWFTQTNTWKKTKAIHLPKKENVYTASSEWFHKLKNKSAEAKAFVTRKDYKEKTSFLIYMSRPTGHNLLFICDI